MKKAKDLKLKMVLCLTVLIILALSIPPMQALAQDADLDGFPDSLEISGFALYDGTFYPPCTSNPPDRSTCVDPATRDLFVILLKGDNPMNPTYGLGPSLIPANPLEFLSNPRTAGGLGVATHIILPGKVSPQYPYPDRTVTPSSSQKAVRVTESLDPSSDKLGVTTGQGMGMDESTVYTAKIKSFIISVCGTTNFDSGSTLCKDSTGLTGQALLDKYIKHTIAHEIGHSLSLTGKSVKNYGGYHYNATDKVEMSQSVYYTKDSQTGVIFYIGTGFISTDQSGFKLY